MAELALVNLCKTYYKNKQPVKAVKNLNLSCRDGEFIALLGPSGCGKSTTLRMIAGLEEITSGEIRIGGKVVNDLDPRHRNIGLAFENYALYPPLSVYDNIAFNLRAKKIDEKTIREEINNIAELLHIKELLNFKPAALSGGQKQRVNIARAIIRKPEVLLLDEPLSHLDGKMRQKMRTEIKRLHTEIKSTTVIVTHDQLEAMALADRIAIINEGELQQFGTPLEIYNYPVNEFVAGFIGEPPMNLFTVTAVREGEVTKFKLDETDINIPVPDNYIPLIKEGEKYRFGIRPNHIEVLKEITPDALQVEVTVFEDLGEESRIYVRINENLLIVQSDQELNFKPGDQLALYFRPEKIHVFDINNGKRIDQKKNSI